eukprot:1747255-Pleurochrysis_carterae.AAC.1
MARVTLAAGEEGRRGVGSDGKSSGEVLGTSSDEIRKLSRKMKELRGGKERTRGELATISGEVGERRDGADIMEKADSAAERE